MLFRSAITVNKVCGSGLKSVMLAVQAIQCNDADVIVAGGQENMNLCPYMLKKARTGYRMNNNKLIDAMVHDGLWDHVNDFHMGISAELVEIGRAWCRERVYVSVVDVTLKKTKYTIHILSAFWYR